MIFEVLFNIIKGAVTLILGLLPNWEPFDLSGMGEAVEALMPAEVGTLLRWLNYYVPLREAFVLGTTALAFWAAMLVYRVTVDILTKLHILGGST